MLPSGGMHAAQGMDKMRDINNRHGEEERGKGRGRGEKEKREEEQI